MLYYILIKGRKKQMPAILSARRRSGQKPESKGGLPVSQICVSDLSFRYPDSSEPVFSHVSFTVDTSWRLGLIGRNGRGKTTLLRLLTGQYPYEGSIVTNAEFACFPCETGDPSRDTLTVLQSVCPAAEEWELLREASLLDVDAETLCRPFSTLSGGERTKLLLAAMFLGEHRFLLIDEPTDHLDAAARAKVGAYLRRKRGFILVSHDRDLLDDCIDHVLVLNRASVEVQNGNFSAWQENKQRADRFAEAENEKHRREIRKLRDAARRTAEWADKSERTKIGYDPVKEHDRMISTRSYIGAKTKKMQSRVASTEKRIAREIEAKEGLLQDIEETAELRLSPEKHPQRVLVHAADLALYYGDKCVCSGVHFDILNGDRIAVTGKNGSGKSTLLRLICGEEIAHTGTLMTGSGLRISYVSQDTSHLRGTLREYADAAGIGMPLFLAILRKMGFERRQFETALESGSEGMKKKVLLARSLCERAHLYVWDEPLNYVDIISRMQLESLLRDSGATLLFVEHDAAFRRNIATKEISLR